VLGHALAMKAIHGGKSKNDKIDSHKIASLLRGGLLPQSYVYPATMRSTRDLLRRRLHLVRKRGQLLAHIQNTRAQYNLPEFERRLAYPANEWRQVGNVHLKWAFSEAAVLFLRHAAGGKKLLATIEKKHGKGKALSIILRLKRSPTLMWTSSMDFSRPKEASWRR
jgi:Transposase